MRKKTIYFLGFIELFILILTLVFFILSSQTTMDYLIKRASTVFNIEYRELNGNLLKDVTLKDVTYKGMPLAKKAHLDINFKALFLAKIKIDILDLDMVNLKTLEQLLKDREKISSKNREFNIEDIPTIHLGSLSFSTWPYKRDDISIDRFKFTANDIKVSLDDFEIGGFSIYSENDYIDITADGTLKNKILKLNHLWTKNIDIVKAKELYKKIKNSQLDRKKDKNSTSLKLISHVEIDDFQADIEPYSYKKYDIKTLYLKVSGLSTDLKTFSTKNSSIDIDTNMWSLSLDGSITDNKLFADAEVILDDKYFKKFVPFFDYKKIEPIRLSLNTDIHKLESKIYLKTSNILTGNFKDINLAVKEATADVDLTFSPFNLTVKIDGDLTTKYSKNIKLDSTLLFANKKFSYDGDLFFKEFQKIEPNLAKLLQNSYLSFNGDKSKIEAILKNRNLVAEYSSNSYKKGVLNIESQDILLREYFKNIPQELSSLEASIKAVVPIDFKKMDNFQADIELNSNAIDIKGEVSYLNGFIFKADTKVSKGSILSNFDKNIKLNKLFPLKIESTIYKSSLETKLIHKDFLTSIYYNLESKSLSSFLNLKSVDFTIDGILGEELKLKASTISLKSLQDELENYYTFKREPIDGEVLLEGTIDSQNVADFRLYSRWLVYEYRPYKFLFAEKIEIDFTKKENQYIVSNYYFSTYLDYDREFFSKRASNIYIRDKSIVIDSLWINDKAKIIGQYESQKGVGLFELSAKNYHYKGVEGDIYFDASIKTHLSKDGTKLEGSVDLLKGVITYKAKKEHYVQDDDIIIVQKEQELKAKKKDSPLIIDVAIRSKDHILYRVDTTKVELKPDITIWKEREGDLELLGFIKLIKGTHLEGQKEFKIESGEIIFAGAILNPFLNINVTHQNDPYLINININGVLDAPVINFSSTPFLSQSDILSILLFSSTTEGLINSEGDSSKAAISMFGNTFAKELVENFGIKLDKLVLTTTEDGKFGVEVGKKISRKMTIIYINDIVQTIKIKYQHSNRFETDLTISPDRSGIDFIYKNEY